MPMNRWRAAGAGLLLMLSAAPAQAGTMFRFTLESIAPAYVPLAAEGTLTLADAALRRGIAIDEASGAFGQSFPFDQVAPDWAALGLLALQFRVAEGTGPARLDVRLQDLQAGIVAGLINPPYTNWSWRLQLNGPPGGALTGLLAVNDSTADVTFGLDGPASRGSFNADAGRQVYRVPDPRGGPDLDLPGCGISGTCSFAGRFEAVPIPEPASLALLGVALAGLAVLRRGRRASAG